MRKTPILLLGAGLLVQFCQNPKQAPEIETKPIEPAVARFACRGASPVLWLVDIYPDSIVYERGGGKKIVYLKRIEEKKGDTTVFKTRLKLYEKESKMTIKIIPDSCSTGQDALRFPYTAIIERDGDVLNGCASGAAPN
ncbi:MAG: hypothetical protein SFV55_13400 [Haliscomenobacter sp.]|uniref:hypothetical protein n=1 Tax=Haliscomenobacter sp. TaxID=2717303 RepID=UPI0029BD731C|nr:hypothetical protein [Haliscomenobacter sp.]MDX2069416.1 hypothetical protein [Haliscomenobacter sp.]